jgi:hypothetical protein
MNHKDKNVVKKIKIYELVTSHLISTKIQYIL